MSPVTIESTDLEVASTASIGKECDDTHIKQDGAQAIASAADASGPALISSEASMASAQHIIEASANDNIAEASAQPNNTQHRQDMASTDKAMTLAPELGVTSSNAEQGLVEIDAFAKSLAPEARAQELAAQAEATSGLGADLVFKNGISKRQQKFANELQSALADGSPIDVRSAVGQKFDRDMSPDEKAAFKKLDNEEKKALRLKWAQKQLGALVETTEKLEEWRRIDTSKGTYMSISKAFAEEGGSAADVAPT